MKPLHKTIAATLLLGGVFTAVTSAGQHSLTEDVITELELQGVSLATNEQALLDVLVREQESNRSQINRNAVENLGYGVYPFDSAYGGGYYIHFEDTIISIWPDNSIDVSPDQFHSASST